MAAEVAAGVAAGAEWAFGVHDGVSVRWILYININISCCDERELRRRTLTQGATALSGGSVLRRSISLNLADGVHPLSQCGKMDV